MTYFMRQVSGDLIIKSLCLEIIVDVCIFIVEALLDLPGLTATSMDITKTLKTFLRNASGRGGMRSKAKKRKSQATQDENEATQDQNE